MSDAIFPFMTNLCKYKDSLGVPGKGIHSYRLFNLAIVDVFFTFLLGLFIWSFTKNRSLVSYIYITLSCFLAGIILHRTFCVKTTIDKFIFG